MIRQLVLASFLAALALSACVTEGPVIMGTCPPGTTEVTNNGNQECARPENVAGCQSGGNGGNGGNGGSCTDAQPNCAAWVATGFCNGPRTIAEKRTFCARSCNLC